MDGEVRGVEEGKDRGVTEMGVYVKSGTDGRDTKPVHLKSSQQPFSPCRITQWRPA